MKMKLNLLLLFLFIAITMHAESITIKQKTGNETIIELSTNPVITFTGEDMVVTNDFTSITIPIELIDSYVVGNSSSGIPAISANSQYRDGHVILKGLAEGATAYIYTISGQVVSQQVANASGSLDINLGNLPKGAYIVKTPNYNIKVINK